MAGLESSLAAAEIAPIASLQFKLPSVSPYVTSRQEVYFSPAGQTFSVVRKSNDEDQLQRERIRRPF